MMKLVKYWVLASVCVFGIQSDAHAQVRSCDQSIPHLDAHIQYYEKHVTPDGVQKEIRFTEKIIRRPHHVWIERVIPKHVVNAHTHKSANTSAHKHKEFDSVLTPRHIFIQGKDTQIEFIDGKEKQVVAVPKGEYDNIQFDGSWTNACFLLDPKILSGWKIIPAKSGERDRKYISDKKDMIQTVTWDEQLAFPRQIEIQSKSGHFYRRIDVATVTATVNLPWEQTKGFIQREYSDFLD